MPYLLGALFCLFPVMVYCLFLAALNQRRQATLVPGPWDFAAVLGAVSGFLLLGGPELLRAAQAASRSWFVRGPRPIDPTTLWPALWIGYGVLLIGGSSVMLWLRRRSTAVYNVDPGYAEDALPRVFTRLGLAWTRQGTGFRIEDTRQGAPRSSAVDIDISPMFWHATLTWSDDAGIRREVEAELNRELATVATDSNPLSGWLLSSAAFVFLLILMLLLFFVVWFVSRT